MRTRILRTALANAVSQVSKAVSVRTTLPALTCIKIKSDREGMTFTGMNSTMTISTHVPTMNGDEKQVFTEESGEILLPGKIFVDIVKKLDEKEVELVASDLYLVQIKSGAAKFKIKGMDPEKFPQMPQSTSENNFKIPKEKLRTLIKKTHFSALSEEKENSIMLGVLWSIGENKITCTATDMRRLSLQSIELKLDEQLLAKSMVIPSKSLCEIVKVFSEYDEDICVSLADDQTLFAGGQTKVYARLLHGTYPTVSKSIPTEWKTKVIIKAESFIGAIERAYLIAKDDEDSSLINITVEDGKVITRSVSAQIGNFFDEVLAKTEGPSLSISLNVEYLLDATRSFDSEHIEIYFNDHFSPCVLRVSEEQESLQLVVPVLTH